MLMVAEYEDGSYRPLGEACSRDEAEELWASMVPHMAKNDEPVPTAVKLWERDGRGWYRVTGELEV